jgi:hypothetical protein
MGKEVSPDERLCDVGLVESTCEMSANPRLRLRGSLP